MREIMLNTEIHKFETCAEFAREFALGADDLLFTIRPIYEAHFAPLGLPVKTLFWEDFGSGEPTDVMTDEIIAAASKLGFRRLVECLCPYWSQRFKLTGIRILLTESQPRLLLFDIGCRDTELGLGCTDNHQFSCSLGLELERLNLYVVRRCGTRHNLECETGELMLEHKVRLHSTACGIRAVGIPGICHLGPEDVGIRVSLGYHKVLPSINLERHIDPVRFCDRYRDIACCRPVPVCIIDMISVEIIYDVSTVVERLPFSLVVLHSIPIRIRIHDIDIIRCLSIRSGSLHMPDESIRLGIGEISDSPVESEDVEGLLIPYVSICQTSHCSGGLCQEGCRCTDPEPHRHFAILIPGLRLAPSC